MYASIDDMLLRFGEAKLTQLTDRVTPPARQPDPAVIGAALEDATQMVDGYAAARYVTPLCPVPAPVRRWCLDIAYYYLHNSGPVPEDVRKGFESALAGLKDMGKGVIVFAAEGLASAELSAAGDIQLDAPERVFTADSMRGF